MLGIDSTSLVDEAPDRHHEGLFKLTVSMGARIQGFPDGWRFQGKKKQIKSQIGNALPPIMAKAVGLAIHAALEDVDFDYETALRAEFTTPPPPQSEKRLGSGLLSSRSRLNMGGGAPSVENLFFDEVRYDEDTGQELIVAPGQYRTLEQAG